MDLDGKHILITGASSGIGRQTAIDASHQGAQLTITGRNQRELDKTFGLLYGKNHLFVQCDLTKPSDIKKLSSELKSLDGIVHCAGVVKPIPTKFIKEQQIDEVFSINFKSVVLLNAGLLQQKKIKNGASVVLISTISANYPYFGGAIYIASKAALEGHGKTLALELASKKIRVNSIQPAMVNTPIYQSTIDAAYSTEEMKKYENQYPLGIGETKDVANTIIFLLSEKSKWITGICLPMDGGLTLGNLKP